MKVKKEEKKRKARNSVSYTQNKISNPPRKRNTTVNIINKNNLSKIVDLNNKEMN